MSDYGHNTAYPRVRAVNAGRVGERVRLVHCRDPYTRLAPGATGTIRLVDDAGTRHVDWDDGHSLGLVADADRWEVIG